MTAYRAALKLGLSESLGSNSDLAVQTLAARGNVNFNIYEEIPPDRVYHSEVRTKIVMLDECIAHLKRVAQRKPAVSTPSAPAAMNVIIQVLDGFHKSVRALRTRRDTRPPLTMSDEYDVQYLLHAFLVAFFRDVRVEETAPSHAGARPRVDFLLKDEQIVIEVKKTRPTLKEKDVGDELLADIGRYRAHMIAKR